MLKLLQPGIQPLGQFDLLDSAVAGLVGGECGALADALATDIADRTPGQPKGPVAGGSLVTQVVPSAAALSQVHGLIDDGLAGYGTLYGTIIGMSAGQGTGFGAQASQGTVTVGPSTTAGSGKATLWTKPGLYGVTADAWSVPLEFTTAVVNAPLYGTAVTGKLTTIAAGTLGEVSVALNVGLVEDRSLVSTTAGAATPEFRAVYLLGPQA